MFLKIQFADTWLFQVYKDMVQVPCQNAFGKTFLLGGPGGPLLCTYYNGSQKYFMHLSVKVSKQNSTKISIF